MNLTLINPPQVFSKFQVAAGVTLPLGIAYLASTCIENGHKVQVIDALGESPQTITEWKNNTFLRGITFDQIISKISNKTELVGISNHFTFSFPVVIELSKRIKEEKGEDLPIVVGGAHPSATPVETLNSPYIDFVIISEGEDTLLKLCIYLSKKTNIKAIDGLAYKENNEINVSPKKQYISDLDSLPFPNRDLLPLENYIKMQEAHGATKYRWTSMISSRGCPFECTFCTSKLWNRSWRARSAENVVDEIEFCIEKYDIREFHFEDENMSLKKERLIEICDEIIMRELDIAWQTPNGIRASTIDNEMLNKMKSSGCYHITVAPESGSERILKKVIRKHQNLNQIRSVIKHASKIGLKTACYFVIGLPRETKNEVKESISFAQTLAKDGLDEVVFSLFIPLPGSELYKEILLNNHDKLQSFENFTSIGDLSKAVSWSEHITDEELSKFRREAYIKFHLTKLLYHPVNSMKSMFNIFRGIEETKTERTIRTFLKRFL